MKTRLWIAFIAFCRMRNLRVKRRKFLFCSENILKFIGVADSMTVRQLILIYR